jgi:type IV secretion system protein VirB10
MEELNPIPEVGGERVVAPPAKLPKPINTARIALYMVMAICLLGLISNLAHFGNANAAKKMPKSLQLSKPAVTSLDALASFQQQQAEDAVRLEKERQAAERLLGRAGESLQRYKDAMLLPCDASLAGTQATAPDGTPIVCTADGSWRPIRGAAPNTPGTTPAQDEAQRRSAEREHRLQEALASSSLAIDFTDATLHNSAREPAKAADGERTELADGGEHRAEPAPSAATSTPPRPPEPTPIAPAPKPKYEWARYAGKLYRVFEGTILETVLTNRINGAFPGPINTMVTTDVWSHDRQHLLIPQGTRCLGSVSAVNSSQQQRLFVSFHRCIMPDGFPLDLDRFAGLSAAGETALRDLVNHHYLQIFGTSLAIGAIGGLAQIGNATSGLVYYPSAVIRNGVSQQTAEESIHVLDRFLNQLPTFLVRERARVKIYLAGDLEVPAYDAHRIDLTI